MKILAKNTALSICLSFLLLGCSESNTVNKPDLNFSVITDEKKSNIKRVVSVELDKRFDKEQLKTIAEYLKSLDANYENIFIAFKIKGEDRLGYWANAEFSPEANVTIYGSDIEEEKKVQEQIAKYQLPKNAELIGKWMNRSAYDTGRVFYKKNGEFFQDEIFDSGITTTKIKQKNDKDGSYFQMEDSVDGYRIQKDGTMEVFNTEENRKIFTMSPLKM